MLLDPSTLVATGEYDKLCGQVLFIIKSPGISGTYIKKVIKMKDSTGKVATTCFERGTL